jgi:hypothetical protein
MCRSKVRITGIDEGDCSTLKGKNHMHSSVVQYRKYKQKEVLTSSTS